MRTEGGKTGTSWELLLLLAASPFSKLYKLVKLGKEGHDDDDDDEDDAFDELLVQLCDCCCKDDDEGEFLRPVSPTVIIRAGA